MKKQLTILSILAACSLGASAQVESKFDVNSQLVISQYRQLRENPAAYNPAVELPFDKNLVARAIQPDIAAIVTIAPGYSTDDIEALGLSVISAIDDMAVIKGQAENIFALAENPCIHNISLARKADAKLNNVRSLVGADKIHAGTDLNRAYTGAGVITGIYDAGVDPNHITFYTNNNASTGTHRVKRIWSFLSYDGSHSTLTTPEKIASFTTDNSAETHGTHTLGCMAGGYNGKGGKWANYNPNTRRTTVSAATANPFYAAATGSDIAVGCGALYDANILAAVGNIVDYAKIEGKPAVINLSIGSHYGPHDGTDNTSKMLSKYAQDAIICIAAGNEGEDNLSIVKNFTASDKSVKTFIVPSSNSFRGQIEVWASNSDALKVTPCIYDLTTNTVVYQYPVEKVMASTTIASSANSNFNQAFSNSSWTIASSKNVNSNNRFSVTIAYNMNYNTSANKNKDRVFALMVEGNAGVRADIVNIALSGDPTLSSRGLAGWTSGSNDLSISSMACNDDLIVVGAYNSRKTWGVISGSAYTYNGDGNEPNEMSLYTSYGVTYNGKSYPLVCAPGSGIISSYSKFYISSSKTDTQTLPAVLQSTHASANNRDHHWECSQGTSMATPILAGCVALWLEADPTLKVADVKRIIVETADKDTYTATTGNAIQWGAGKFNAYAGLKKVLNQSGGVEDVAADASKVLLTQVDNRTWEVFKAGAGHIKANIYNLSGALVASASSNGDTAQISAQHLSPGVYVINVNATDSFKVVVK